MVDHKFKEVDIQLNTAAGTIYGTLTLPKNDTEVPVVLIIAGSGPTDRDGNNAYGVLSDSYYLGPVFSPISFQNLNMTLQWRLRSLTFQYLLFKAAQICRSLWTMQKY